MNLNVSSVASSRTWPLSHSLTDCRSKSAVGTECEACSLSRSCQRRSSAERGGQGEARLSSGIQGSLQQSLPGGWTQRYAVAPCINLQQREFVLLQRGVEKRRLRSAWTSPAFGSIENTRTLFLQKRWFFGRFCSSALHVVNGEWLKSVLKSLSPQRFRCFVYF